MRHSIWYVGALVFILIATTGCQHCRGVRRRSGIPRLTNNRLNQIPPEFLGQDGLNDFLNNPFQEGFDPSIFNRAGFGPNPGIGGPGVPGGPLGPNVPAIPTAPDATGIGGERRAQGFTDFSVGPRQYARLPDTSAAPSLRVVREVTEAVRHVPTRRAEETH